MGCVCPGKEKWPCAGNRIEGSTLAGERTWKVSGRHRLLCTCESRCQKLCSLRSEPQGLCKEPKRSENPSEKQPKGTLPAHALPALLHVEQPASGGSLELQLLLSLPNQTSLLPSCRLYQEIVSLTAPKLGFFLEAEGQEVR